MICVSLQISIYCQRYLNLTIRHVRGHQADWFETGNFYIGHSAAAANVIRKYPRGVRILENKVYRIKVFDLFLQVNLPLFIYIRLIHENKSSPNEGKQQTKSIFKNIFFPIFDAKTSIYGKLDNFGQGGYNLVETFITDVLCHKTNFVLSKDLITHTKPMF